MEGMKKMRKILVVLIAVTILVAIAGIYWANNNGLGIFIKLN